MKRSTSTKALAVILILTLHVGVGPLLAASDPASLGGVIHADSGARPLHGVKVFAGDPTTERVYPSQPTGADGRFDIADLPPGTYELAVAVDAGLYVVETPVVLAPGMSQLVNISLDNGDEGAGGDPEGAKPAKSGGGGKSSVWNNPLTAALIVIGAAIVVGVAVEAATDDSPSEPPASPFTN